MMAVTQRIEDSDRTQVRARKRIPNPIETLWHRMRGTFDSVNSYCMFLGYPRTGHSLFGSLLDAHPSIIIAHEFNVFYQLKKRQWDRHKLFTALLYNSESLMQMGRCWSGYSYEVPGQWQGRFEHIEVIGDKKGGGTTREIISDPGTFEKLRGLLGTSIKLRVFHILRNPYDSVASMVHGRRREIEIAEKMPFYLDLLNGAQMALTQMLAPNEVMTIRHEDLIRQPQQTIGNAMTFLGQQASQEYLDACASILFEKPRQKRHVVEWKPDELKRIEEAIEQYSFLQGYNFAD
jgi:hypothetical protein